MLGRSASWSAKSHCAETAELRLKKKGCQVFCSIRVNSGEEKTRAWELTRRERVESCTNDKKQKKGKDEPQENSCKKFDMEPGDKKGDEQVVAKGCKETLKRKKF